MLARWRVCGARHHRRGVLRWASETTEPPLERRPNRALRRRLLADLAMRRDALDVKVGKTGEWGTTVSVLIERTQVVMSEPEPWQEAMWKLQAELEKYDGFDYPPAVKKALGADKVPDNLASKTVPFPLAPRVTQADRDNDRSSLDRALDDSLYLVVTDDGQNWHLPEVTLAEDDRVRDAGERALEGLGKGLYTYLLGNAPIAVWFAEPTDADRRRHAFSDDVVALKQYIMKAIIVDSYKTDPVKLDPSTSMIDFAWITKNEIDLFFPVGDPHSEYLKLVF